MTFSGHDDSTINIVFVTIIIIIISLHHHTTYTYSIVLYVQRTIQSNISKSVMSNGVKQ